MSNQQSGRMILVVDDERAVCQSIASVLRSKGYLVHTASDGVEALRLLESIRLDLIVSDVNMPGMSGFELISTIRSRFPDMPVVAMSGKHVADGQLGKCSAFYAKGQGPEQLLSVVDELLVRSHNLAGVKEGKEAARFGSSEERRKKLA